VKILSPVPLLLLLCATALPAQPRVFEDRPLVRAVRHADLLVGQGNYAVAITEIEGALDTAASGEHLADALYLLSRANFMMSRYRPALSASRRFLEGYPFDTRAGEVLYLRGISAYQEGKLDESEAAFRRVAAEGENNRREAYYWIARASADRNRPDSAEHYATLSLAGDPHEFTDDALYLHAWLTESRGAIDTAATLYRKLLDDYPGSDLELDAQLRLGVIDARRGNYESAIRLLNSITPRSERQREEQLFYLGEVSAALGRYDEALRYDTEFLRSFPKSTRVRPARYGIGWAQLNLGRHDEAIATFRQLEDDIDSIAAAASYQIGAIQMTKGDTVGAERTFQELLYKLPYESFSDNAYYQLGRINYRRARYDSARHYLLIAARQFPESDVRPDAYYLLGESYAALADAGNAQYAFSRAEKTGATGDLYRRALYREGIMLYKVGRFHSAVDRFREYVSEHPKGREIGDATFWLGEALYQDRAYDEAERYYNAYVERYATGEWREQALYGLAWSRFQQKDFKGSSRAFADFIKNNPESPLTVEATIRLADSYRFLGEYDKAIATYESIGGRTGKGVRDEEARFRLADVFLQMGNVDRAVETFRQLIADYPSSPRRDAYAYDIGTIYHEKDRDSLAIVELIPFATTYPESQLRPQATFTIGDAYYNLEQYDSALVYYRRVLDDYPNSVIIPQALDAVRFTLDALGRGREAVAIIDSFQARNPTRLPADSLAFRKAGIILEGGEFDQAIALYDKLIRDFPESPIVPSALFQMGRGYEYLGKRDSAVLLYQQVVARYPASDAASDALIEAAGLKLREGDWAEASKNYEQFLAQYNDTDRVNEAHYGIATAKLALRDTAGALAEFKTVLDSSRDKEDDLFLDKSRIATARLIAPRGETDRALELLAAVVARRLDDVAAEALLLRGELLLKSNDLSGALSELRRFTGDFASYTDYAEPGLLLLGTVYEQLTNYASAREVYTNLMAQAQSPDIRKEAEARLKKLKK
jgi:TolA-binding protein